MATEDRAQGLAERWEVVEDVPKFCGTCGAKWLGRAPRFLVDITSVDERIDGVCDKCADEMDAEAKRFAKTFNGVEMVKGSSEALKVEEAPDVEQEMLNLNGMPDMTQ